MVSITFFTTAIAVGVLGISVASALATLSVSRGYKEALKAKDQEIQFLESQLNEQRLLNAVNKAKSWEAARDPDPSPKRVDVTGLSEKERRQAFITHIIEEDAGVAVANLEETPDGREFLVFKEKDDG